MLLTKAHYELMAQFEREYKNLRLDREDKEMWPRGNLYQDGRVNDLFSAYRKGFSSGKIYAEIYGNAAEKLAAAPVAIMDTRDALGLCAPSEDAFPALYALQGRRVALVDLGPADGEYP